jgi:hypothetical protein
MMFLIEIGMRGRVRNERYRKAYKTCAYTEILRFDNQMKCDILKDMLGHLVLVGFQKKIKYQYKTVHIGTNTVANIINCDKTTEKKSQDATSKQSPSAPGVEMVFNDLDILVWARYSRVHATHEKQKEEAFKELTTAGTYFPGMCHKEVNAAAVAGPETDKLRNGEVDKVGKTAHNLLSDTIREDGGRSNENCDASLVTPNTMLSKSGREFRVGIVEGDDVLGACLYPLSQIGIELRLSRLQVVKEILDSMESDGDSH